MVDVVTTGGLAYEYHEGSGLTYLWSGVRSAKAGQGVSYVLLTDGNLYEFKDDSSTWTFIDGDVTSINAGTDKLGINMVDLVKTSGTAWEHSDSSGWHALGFGVHSVSAGQQGVSGYVTTAGKAYSYDESSRVATLQASNVAAITIGTDPTGQTLIDLLYSGGALYDDRAGSGWTLLGNQVRSVSKAHAGLVGAVTASGHAYSVS